MPLLRDHGLWRPPPECPADSRGNSNHHRERHSEYGQGHQCGNSKRHERRVPEGTTANSHHGLSHDRQHRWSDCRQDGGDHSGVAGPDVERGEPQERDHPGQHEQSARDQAAAHSVEQPADVDRELLCLGAWEQGAVRKGVQESLLADPALLVDQDALHDRDLAGRTTEGLQRDGEPDLGGVTQWYEVLPRRRRTRRGRVAG